MKRILRSALNFLFKLNLRLESKFDKEYIAPDVPLSDKIAHTKWKKYLVEQFNKEGLRILEVGSREVTAHSSDRQKFGKATYIGFDYYEGTNVDVVGDAHVLSKYFEGEEKFDLIYSSACFEHFAMPWLVAQEMGKLLKVGGHVFVETHFSYSAHERPWNFFQFSDMALKVLFSEAMGFQCIEAGMSNPMVGRFSSLASEYLKNKPVRALYCHSEYLGKKVKEVDGFKWEETSVATITDNTFYPAPENKW